jgi:hypothetical protein
VGPTPSGRTRHGHRAVRCLTGVLSPDAPRCRSPRGHGCSRSRATAAWPRCARAASAWWRRCPSRVGPAVALKRIVIEALVGSEGAATAATAGGGSLGGLAATALVTVAIPVGGLAAGLAVWHDGAPSGRDRADHAAAHAPGRALDRAAPVAIQHELCPRGGSLRSAVVTPPRRRTGHATASSPTRQQPNAGAGCVAGGCRQRPSDRRTPPQPAPNDRSTATVRVATRTARRRACPRTPRLPPSPCTRRPARPARPAGHGPRPAPAADPASAPQTGAPPREEGSSAPTQGGQRPPGGAAAGPASAGAAQTSALAFLREDGYR